MFENYKYLFPLNIGHHKNTFLKLSSCIIPINDPIPIYEGKGLIMTSIHTLLKFSVQ